MLRKRLIFTLLYADGYFWLSRNFRLQKVGTIDWLKHNYGFETVSAYIDELIVLNVGRNGKDIDDFSNVISDLVQNVFIPVAAGGGITSLSDAQKLFDSGADKLVMNTIFFENENVVKDIIAKYGSQSIVASVDYRIDRNEVKPFNNNGMVEVPMSLDRYVNYLQKSGVGEIYLNSIDRDGTGFGMDLDVHKAMDKRTIPMILAGGAGNESHLEAVLNNSNYNAVATANLFNFVGDGLPLARKYLEDRGSNISPWYSLKNS